MRCRYATSVVRLRDVDELYPGESDGQLNSRRAYAVSTQTLRKPKNDHLVLALPHIEYGFEPILDDGGGSDFDACADDDWVIEGL